MKYCITCGAELVKGAAFCGKCGAPVGEVIKQGQENRRREESLKQIKPASGTLPFKYQIGSIAMFVHAGITIPLIMIELSDMKDELREMFVQQLDTMEYIGIALLIVCVLLSVGIDLHCGFLLRKIQLRGKGGLAAYSVFWGICALWQLANGIAAMGIGNLLSFVYSVGACVLMAMKRYEWGKTGKCQDRY